LDTLTSKEEVRGAMQNGKTRKGRLVKKQPGKGLKKCHDVNEIKKGRCNIGTTTGGKKQFAFTRTTQ